MTSMRQCMPDLPTDMNFNLPGYLSAMPVKFFLKAVTLAGLVSLPVTYVYAETYLTVDQAKKALWENTALYSIPVTLTKQQMDSIELVSKTRVKDSLLNAWKTNDGGWFIVDQVVGKHEMIDIAVALTSNGTVKGIEVLTYRETYGGEVKNPKWLAQFLGRGHTENLKLDEQVKNISGATLSCRHITDGINRLTHTWDHVLKYL